MFVKPYTFDCILAFVFLKKQKKALTKRFVRCYHPTRKGKGVYENTVSETLFSIVTIKQLKKGKDVFHVDNRKGIPAFFNTKGVSLHYEKKKCFKILWLHGF